ncbi:hypothetical protein CF319_g503 [Tilletia indica]|nr:hypothetical protein CF319_g503 [Tilletia indica]
MARAGKHRRLTRRRRRDEFDVDGADCYTADSDQIYGQPFAEPAINMTHNHLPVSIDPHFIERASRQIQDNMAQDDDFDTDFGNDFSNDYRHEDEAADLDNDSDSGSDGYDSDEGAVDLNGHPILVQAFGLAHNRSRTPLSRSHAATSVRRFAAWHQVCSTLFRAVYDANPTLRFPSPPVIECPCPDHPNRRLIAIHVYDIGKPTVIAGHACATHLVESLVNTGLFPASPSSPRVAFTIRLLRLFQTLIDQVGISASSMASTVQTLMRLEPTSQRAYSNFHVGDTLRRQMKSAVTWMTVVERYAHHLATTEAQAWTPSRPSLADDDLQLTLSDLVEN